MLDVQRPGLIDLNIRELCERFVEVVGIEHNKDKSGNITSTEFTLREFPDWKFVDKYLNGDDSLGELVQEVFEGNVFEHYKSQSYFSVFLPPLDSDFDYLVHPMGEDVRRDISWELYSQIAPPGFYGKGGKK